MGSARGGHSSASERARSMRRRPPPRCAAVPADLHAPLHAQRAPDALDAALLDVPHGGGRLPRRRVDPRCPPLDTPGCAALPARLLRLLARHAALPCGAALPAARCARQRRTADPPRGLRCAPWHDAADARPSPTAPSAPPCTSSPGPGTLCACSRMRRGARRPARRCPPPRAQERLKVHLAERRITRAHAMAAGMRHPRFARAKARERKCRAGCMSRWADEHLRPCPPRRHRPAVDQPQLNAGRTVRLTCMPNVCECPASISTRSSRGSDVGVLRQVCKQWSGQDGPLLGRPPAHKNAADNGRANFYFGRPDFALKNLMLQTLHSQHLATRWMRPCPGALSLSPYPQNP